MKKALKMVGISFVLLFAFCLMQKPLKAEAATTYTAFFEGGKWCFKDDKSDFYTNGGDFIPARIQAGDVLVIDGKGIATEMLKLEFNVRVGEIAVIGGATASIKAPGVDKAYAVRDGSTLIFTGDVKTLVANYGGTEQVVGNVDEVVLNYSDSQEIKIGITGTVGKANVRLYPNNWSDVTVYNVAAGKFEVGSDNYFKTANSYYSTVASKSNGGRQLDSVPKTGGPADHISMAPVYFAIALILASAAVVFMRKNKEENA